jgi:hypothetical protein
MGPFQKIIILLFVILLIIILIFIGYSITDSQNKTWPPVVADCPDYWLDESGDGSKCVNVKDLGTCNGSVTSGNHLTMDFTVSPYKGVGSICKKYTWANSCGLTWDGITNLSTNPCIFDSFDSTFTLT